MALYRRTFGRMPDGTDIEAFSLEADIAVRVVTYGATVVQLFAPDRRGAFDNVVLGFDTLGPYLAVSPYFGATIGRVANRIARGMLPLGGRVHQLTLNDGPNHLHGGVRGFDKHVWRAEPLSEAPEPAVRFTHTSPDGDQGYPGTLAASVVFTLAGDTLRLEYEARADAPTAVSLTHHGYFNLAGAGRGTVLDHVVTLHAACFTPVDGQGIPTGEIAAVEGTPFDFRVPCAIGARIAELPGGYDHNYALDAPGEPNLAARVHDPASGRVLEVATDQPGIQFYSGNFLDGSIHGRRGPFVRHGALCLEPQQFPDAVNRPRFPSPFLAPGAVYRQVSTYRFTTA